MGRSEKVGLRGANGGVTVIVHDKKLDRQVQAGDGLQLLNVELKAAIAIHANGAAPSAGETDADAARNGVPHGAETGGMVNPLAGAGGAGEQKDLNGAAGTAGNHQVVGRGFLPENFGKVIDADAARGLAMLLQNYGVSCLPIGAALLPAGAILGLNRRRLA